MPIFRSLLAIVPVLGLVTAIPAPQGLPGPGGCINWAPNPTSVTPIWNRGGNATLTWKPLPEGDFYCEGVSGNAMIFNATSSFAEDVGSSIQGFSFDAPGITFPVPDALPTGDYFIMLNWWGNDSPTFHMN